MASNFLSVAFGGGRNGAMLIGMAERGIKPNVITFANTGRLNHSLGEKPGTYAHVERMSRWCEKEFGIPITEVHKDGKYTSLYDQSIETSTLPSAAYGLRSCSDKWKIQPQEKFLNNYPPAMSFWNTCVNCGRDKSLHSNRVDKWCIWAGGASFESPKMERAVGYDAGEQKRAVKFVDDAKYRNRYFLIEWRWFLEDCIEAYKRHGLPVPVKSACYYCPSSTKEEVIRLHDESPDLFWSAVAMEDNALASGTLRNIKGLGRHWSWRELISIQPAQRESLIEAPQMACACFDSEDE